MRNYLPKVLIGSYNRNLECKILNRNRSIHLRKYQIKGLPMLISLKLNRFSVSNLITPIPVNFEKTQKAYTYNQLVFVHLVFTCILFTIRNWLTQLIEKVAKRVQSTQGRPPGREYHEQSVTTWPQKEAVVHNRDSLSRESLSPPEDFQMIQFGLSEDNLLPK